MGLIIRVIGSNKGLTIRVKGSNMGLIRVLFIKPGAIHPRSYIYIYIHLIFRRDTSMLHNNNNKQYQEGQWPAETRDSN